MLRREAIRASAAAVVVGLSGCLGSESSVEGAEGLEVASIEYHMTESGDVGLVVRVQNPHSTELSATLIVRVDVEGGELYEIRGKVTVPETHTNAYEMEVDLPPDNSVTRDDIAVEGSLE